MLLTDFPIKYILGKEDIAAFSRRGLKHNFKYMGSFLLRNNSSKFYGIPLDKSFIIIYIHNIKYIIF
jgi:hypothetical protein